MARKPRFIGLDEFTVLSQIPTPYICRSCRHFVFRQRLAGAQSVRHVSSKTLPFTERLRRKIWGTDNPPGLKDPYGGPSFLERWQEERRSRNDVALPLPESETKHDTVPSLQSHAELRSGTDEGLVQKMEYIPAKTWDRLEHVGHKGDWWDIPPTVADEFTPFLQLSGRIARVPNDFLSAIHQAVVEIITLQQENEDMDMSTEMLSWNRDGFGIIANTKIEVSLDSSRIRLIYPKNDAQHMLVTSMVPPQKGTTEEDESRPSIKEDLEARKNGVQDGEEASDRTRYGDAFAPEVEDESSYNDAAQERDGWQLARDQPSTYYPVSDQSFLNFTLDLKNPAVFPIIKRFTQLTGLRIPDPIIASATSLRSLYIYALESIKPKPKSLAEKLIIDGELTKLPNVRILMRRETPVDRDKAVGRWKVIEKELKARGLPVLGRAYN